MSSEAQKNKQTKLRDYDKEPIVIEDYNPLFIWLSFKYVLFPFLILLWIITFLYFPEENFEFFKLLIFIPISSWPAYNLYKNTKGKRKIVLSNRRISYKHTNYVITEIFLDKSPNLYLSFQNFYHKSQNRLKMWHIIVVFLMGLLITQSILLNFFIFLFAYLFAFLALQIVKFIIHTEKYRFYHALLLIIEDDVISISLLNQNDYLEVQEYFARKNICIESLPKFHKLIYGYENINIKQGK